MDKLKECFEKGLLKKISAQKDLAKKDIKRAEFFLKETEDLIKIEKIIMAGLSLYNSYFHCLRAILFKDGIKERSHYCMARYFEKHYVNKKKIKSKYLNAFETAKNLRNNIQYSTETVLINENLDELYNICEDFIETVKKIL